MTSRTSLRRPAVAALVLACGLTALAAAPASSLAMPPPPPLPGQDSVVVTGAQAAGFTNIDIQATSGPSGENPAGQASFLIGGSLVISGPLTCLSVTGNSAFLKFNSASAFGLIAVAVTDNGPAGTGDTFFAFPVFGTSSSDCTPFQLSSGGPLTSGDVVVHDAPPPPTSTSQCKDGGWEQYGFRNQGQCVASVVRGPGPSS